MICWTWKGAKIWILNLGVSKKKKIEIKKFEVDEKYHQRTTNNYQQKK
jgi:hypothetical protein